MNRQRPSCAWVIFLIATQVLGPAVLSAADQRGIRVEASDRVVISAISGEQLTAQSTNGSKTLHFGDTVSEGDQIATGDRTVAEVLLGNRAVLTLGEGTTAQLTTLSPEQTTIQVTQGIMRVAASADALGEQGTMTIQTPTGQVETHGGIVRVMVNAPVGSAEQTATGEAKPYLTSYAPNPMVAALNTRGDIIQVEEGTAEIAGAGPGGEALTVEAGQSVTRQPGQAGSISALATADDMRAEVLASADHANTPQEGVEHLVALQVDQATALGIALTVAGKTEQDKTEKDDVQNAIIGPTGGLSGNTSTSTILNALFGGGNAFGPSTPNPTDSTGAGFGGNNSQGFVSNSENGAQVQFNGRKALLVFTRLDPGEAFMKETTNLIPPPPSGGNFPGGTFLQGSLCGDDCILNHVAFGQIDKVGSRQTLPPVISKFTVKKELVLVGGTPNDFHGGVAPRETLIVRGLASSTPPNNQAIFPNDNFSSPSGKSPPDIVRTNSTFVVETLSEVGTVGVNEDGFPIDAFVGGTLGQYSNRDDNGVIIGAPDLFSAGDPAVDGAITATGPDVVLSGGVTLDRGTQSTISTTAATNNYFTSLGGADAKFDGSLLSVIHGPDGPTALTVQDRLLGVFDGSSIGMEGGNKALLSVLDAKLKGPSSGVPLIDIDAAFLDADVNNSEGSGGTPEVTVTSAVVTRSTMPLDGALLEASAPLLALTQAMMTTTSHFADLAGNQTPSMNLNDALVALNASQLIIESGHLLNLNNATATVNGYLFSLNNNSQLQLNNGALFSLNNGSALNLKANALGVFGSGANTLSITNNLCAATCGNLVNSANAPFMLNGSPLKVAGVTQDVVLPNSFNVFAAAPNAQPAVNIAPNAAVFHVDDTSTLTINGAAVVKP